MTGRLSDGKMSTRMRDQARAPAPARPTIATMTVTGWRSANAIGFTGRLLGWVRPQGYQPAAAKTARGRSGGKKRIHHGGTEGTEPHSWRTAPRERAEPTHRRDPQP